MYKSEYQISGMTCQGCVNSIKKQFSTDDRIISSEIDLNSSNLNLESTVDLKPGDLNTIIGDLKKYNVSYKTFSPIDSSDKDKNSSGNMKEQKKFTPLIISLLLITLLALVPQIRDGFNVEGFMKSLMGYFFVIFSLFKLLNIKGFSDSDYEVISDRSNAIQAALDKMEKNSILLVLGKGRENYQMIGSEKQPHSDIDIIRQYQYAD